jgi:hypothetical protein
MSVATQLYFQMVEEINYMLRPFSAWVIIRLRLEYRRKFIYYNVDIKNGEKRSRFTMFGEVRSYICTLNWYQYWITQRGYATEDSTYDFLIFPFVSHQARRLRPYRLTCMQKCGLLISCLKVLFTRSLRAQMSVQLVPPAGARQLLSCALQSPYVVLRILLTPVLLAVSLSKVNKR